MTNWRKYAAPAAIILVLPTAGYATQYITVKEAKAICFPAATSFEIANVFFTPEQIKQIETRSGVKVQNKGQQMWRAMQGDKLLGYLVADYVIGKHLVIDYVVALSPEGILNRVEILEYRESYGSEIKNRDWLKQFIGKTKESKLTLNDDIVNIGGATFSSRHVTEGIKRVLTTFDIITRSDSPRP